MNIHGKDIKIFSGNASKNLAQEIVKCLDLSLGQSEVTKFSDGEISVSIKESIRGSDVFVLQSMAGNVNDNIMELLIMIDAFKRASAGRITAAIPYFGYGRQDRKSKARDPISAKLLADLITTAGADRVLTMDLHASQIQGFFNIPVDNLVGASLLAKYFTDFSKDCDKNEIVIIPPDLGAVSRARKFSESFMGCPLAIIDKRRPSANVSEVMNIIGDVQGKKAIIIDDMIDTAGTVCNAAKALIEIGGASEVYVGVTHGVLSGKAIENIKSSYIKNLVILNTIELDESKKIEKIKILSVGPLFADAILRIYKDNPISILFSE